MTKYSGRAVIRTIVIAISYSILILLIMLNIGLMRALLLTGLFENFDSPMELIDNGDWHLMLTTQVMVVGIVIIIAIVNRLMIRTKGINRVCLLVAFSSLIALSTYIELNNNCWYMGYDEYWRRGQPTKPFILNSKYPYQKIMSKGKEKRACLSEEAVEKIRRIKREKNSHIRDSR